MGYAVADPCIIDANLCGVPQQRLRSVMIGIKADRADHLLPAVLSKPFRRSVGEAIVDVAFPELGKIQDIPAADRSLAQIQYERWATNWISKFGSQELVSDTIALARAPKKRQRKMADEPWLSHRHRRSR